MIHKYLRKKVDKAIKRRNKELTNSALELHTGAVLNLTKKVPSNIQPQLVAAIIGKNPEFYAQVAAAQRYQSNFNVLKDTFYCFLDKIISH